jgi:hypothetical protein
LRAGAIPPVLLADWGLLEDVAAHRHSQREAKACHESNNDFTIDIYASVCDAVSVFASVDVPAGTAHHQVLNAYV